MKSRRRWNANALWSAVYPRAASRDFLCGEGNGSLPFPSQADLWPGVNCYGEQSRIPFPFCRFSLLPAFPPPRNVLGQKPDIFLMIIRFIHKTEGNPHKDARNCWPPSRTAAAPGRYTQKASCKRISCTTYSSACSIYKFLGSLSIALSFSKNLPVQKYYPCKEMESSFSICKVTNSLIAAQSGAGTVGFPREKS